MQENVPLVNAAYGHVGVAAPAFAMFCDSRALSFQVSNSDAWIRRWRSNSSHLVPTSAARFFSGPKIWLELPFKMGASPPYVALVPSNSAPTGLDDVA